MALRTIQEFRRNGLVRPVRAKPGLRSWLFLLFGAPFLIGGSFLALTDGGPIEFLAGLIGLPFFGIGFLIYLIVLLRAGKRGLLEFSERGIYHALYGIEIPWADIGPAWIFGVRAGGADHSDVLFIVRNASRYRRQLGSIGRILFGMMERQGRSKPGGALEKGMAAFGMVFGETKAGSETAAVLREMRDRLHGEPDTIVLGIPRIIRFGLSNEDTVEIINATLTSKLDRREATPLA
jgi:hypothetical protein